MTEQTPMGVEVHGVFSYPLSLQSIIAVSCTCPRPSLQHLQYTRAAGLPGDILHTFDA